jgi:hypothetical protein
MYQKYVEEGNLLLLYYPAFSGILGFRVLGIANKTAPRWNYGPLPISFPDSIGTIHEVGVIPALFINPSPYQIPNTLVAIPTTYAQDFTYHEEPNHIYHFFVNFNNALLRQYVQVPIQQTEQLYKTSLNPPADVGWKSGEIELISTAYMRTGWFTANLTNRNLRTNLVIEVYEYQVDVVQNGSLLYQMYTRQGDGRNTTFKNIGSERWGSDLKMFSTLGFQQPIPVSELVTSRGAQSVIDRYRTAPAQGVVFE